MDMLDLLKHVVSVKDMVFEVIERYDIDEVEFNATSENIEVSLKSGGVEIIKVKFGGELGRRIAKFIEAQLQGQEGEEE